MKGFDLAKLNKELNISVSHDGGKRPINFQPKPRSVEGISLPYLELPGKPAWHKHEKIQVSIDVCRGYAWSFADKSGLSDKERSALALSFAERVILGSPDDFRALLSGYGMSLVTLHDDYDVPISFAGSYAADIFSSEIDFTDVKAVLGNDHLYGKPEVIKTTLVRRDLNRIWEQACATKVPLSVNSVPSHYLIEGRCSDPFKIAYGCSYVIGIDNTQNVFFQRTVLVTTASLDHIHLFK